MAEIPKGPQVNPAAQPLGSPVIIGLVGGIACGKSTVAALLEELGGLWLDSDKMAHEVLELPDVVVQLRKRLGSKAFDEHGNPDRRRIAKLVFGDSPASRADRHWLEQLVHPRVRAMTESRISSEGRQHPAVVIDAPLLIEAGWHEKCDRVLMVDAPLERRLELAERRGWSAEELARREAAQLPIHEKRGHATDVITNNGDLQQLAAQVAQFWKTRVLAKNS